MSAIGPMLSKREVERWVLETILEFTPVYLVELQRRTQPPGTLEPWLGKSRGGRTPRFVSGQLPGLHVYSEGLADAPARVFGGWDASWAVIVNVFVSDTQDATGLCDDYTAMVRSILTEHESLMGRADGLRWADEDVRELDLPGDTIAGSALAVIVDTYDAAGSDTGPDEPPANPYAALPQPADIVDLTVEVDAVASTDG